jgi:hypothetical protein
LEQSMISCKAQYTSYIRVELQIQPEVWQTSFQVARDAQRHHYSMAASLYAVPISRSMLDPNLSAISRA